MKTPSFSLALLVALVPLTAAGTALAATPGTGTITGTVTQPGGNRLPDICVDVSDSQGTLGGTQTNTAGEYSIGNLPAGDSVLVGFHDCSTNGNWAMQWYKGSTTQSGATHVVVPDGGTVGSIDATMTPGVVFSGTVTDTSGNPIPNVCVFVSDPQHSTGSGNTTDANGSYRASGLQPGTYTVEFDAGCYGQSKYDVQWYDGAATEDQATQLTGTASQEFTHIDAQLQSAPSTPPTVTGVSPSSGPTSGGSEVTITGTGLTSADTVKFGQLRAYRVTPISATQIRVVSPPESAGTIDVTVTTATGTSAVNDSDQFTYDPSQPALVPTVTSVSPTSGPTSGGGFVTIDGDNLDGAYEVDFGTVQAQEFTTVSNTELQVRVPAHDVGTVDITVKTQPLGPTANTPADLYTYDEGVNPELPEAPVALLIPVVGIATTAFIVRRRRRSS